tara:strand:- start:485 stop:682 length:198 start_codon:yes stop_codon:yes gene_type:complete
MCKIGCKIKLGDMVEGLISFLTLGNGKEIAMFVANKLGYETCGCEERRIYLNKITCKDYKDGIQF